MKTHMFLIGFLNLPSLSFTEDPYEPEPEIPEDQIILGATIDEAGGKLQTEDFRLNVPARALDAVISLTLVPV